MFEGRGALTSFFDEALLKEFHNSYDADNFLFAPKLRDEASTLLELPFLKSIDQLLEYWPEKVNSYLDGVADEVNSHSVDQGEALSLFKEGRGLFFDDPNRFNTIIDQWLRGLHSDLGLSQMTYSRSLIYALAKGSGTATHFDQNTNIILQISGTKKWWLAKNQMVSNPMTRYTLGTQIDSELESYVDGEVITEMPSDAQEVELSPGSLLFLPRGMWHKTEALSDAISLNFTFSAPTWIDLLTSALRAHLSQSSEWRRTANHVADPLKADGACIEFDRLLENFKRDFDPIRASNILSMTEYNPADKQPT